MHGKHQTRIVIVFSTGCKELRSFQQNIFDYIYTAHWVTGVNFHLWELYWCVILKSWKMGHIFASIILRSIAYVTTNCFISLKLLTWKDSGWPQFFFHPSLNVFVFFMMPIMYMRDCSHHLYTSFTWSIFCPGINFIKYSCHNLVLY